MNIENLKSKKCEMNWQLTNIKCAAKRLDEAHKECEDESLHVDFKLGDAIQGLYEAAELIQDAIEIIERLEREENESNPNP